MLELDEQSGYFFIGRGLHQLHPQMRRSGESRYIDLEKAFRISSSFPFPIPGKSLR